MNTSDQSYDSATEEQASLWAAKLEGSSLSAADRAALDAWLAASPVHRALLSDYCQFSADLEKKFPALVAAGAVKRLSGEVPARRGFAFPWYSYAALAAAALVVFAVWPRRPFENIATNVAQRQTVTLEDGSRVELNARTRLQVQLGATERHVRLIEGEAFFTVSKDKTRPFIVETPAGSVRVTGTVFNVRTETAAEFEVTVVEGSVQVRPASAERDAPPVLLGAGDQFAAGSKQALPAGDLADALAWRQGTAVFNGARLSEAVARFAHYHGRAIVVAPGAADLRISGRHGLDDLDGFFAYIKDAVHVQVTADPDGTFRVALPATP